MPGAVMETFKNFIRHGKHARTTAQPTTGVTTVSPAKASVPLQDGHGGHLHHQPAAAAGISTSTKQRRQEPPRHIDLEPAREAGRVTQDTQGNATFANNPPISTPYAREAELIVKEEREAKGKMPVYKGLERFKIVEKMGDGAFSNVYKAIDLDSGKKVAVKVVRKYELNASQEGNKHLNPNFKKRPRVTERANILKEVQIMRGIDHPSIVKLISFSESQEHYFLVLELMEGGELFHQIVKLTYFSEHLARHVILQVAKGIRYLHEERGVVHRDIKPENILFERIPIIPSKNQSQRPYDEDKEDEGEFIDGVGGGGIGRVKIADFGLSKIVWDEQTMTPCGTVGYTAPEIVKDERYSKSVDMWALGCVLYTLLCGFPPFYDESINVLTEKVARGYYTFLSPWWDDISASSKDLITHLLCVDPTQRYTIDEFLAHPWCNEARGQVPSTPALRTPAIQYDSPLLAPTGGGRTMPSPGVATLKEAFDITYAVHRMEEEGARRRAYNGPGGAGTRGFLGGLNEESEGDEEDGVVEEVEKKYGREAAQALEDRRSTATASAVQNSQPGAGHRRVAVGSIAEGRAGARDQGPARAGVAKQRKGPDASGGFPLDMNNATLLGRRHRNIAEPSPLGQPAAFQKAMSPVPMQIG
ncbi:hypothetical protein FRB94_007015 [Tulasnella sp. JGI-2019a]|nr:hypothetical protein FRB94_007015 [Tulasnella sp. JGI-2019a]KAG9016928.1 hypothetical protein FRB93_009458 [Tulasnella sp. JGI-2019a]